MGTTKRKKRCATVRISKYCSNKGCGRVAVAAEKVSDFWVVRCEECRGKRITLDVNTIVPEK